MVKEQCMSCSIAPVFIKKSMECKKCYYRRYFHERHPRELGPTREPLGFTLRSATPCSYDAAHMRVRATRGLPHTHDCVECGGAAEEWSYRGGSEHEIQGEVTFRHKRGGTKWSRWSPYVWDYDPLCRECHHVRDAGILPRTAGRREKANV